MAQAAAAEAQATAGEKEAQSKDNFVVGLSPQRRRRHTHMVHSSPIPGDLAFGGRMDDTIADDYDLDTSNNFIPGQQAGS